MREKLSEAWKNGKQIQSGIFLVEPTSKTQVFIHLKIDYTEMLSLEYSVWGKNGEGIFLLPSSCVLSSLVKVHSMRS